MNILIIEDDPTDMKLLMAVLSSSGHELLGNGSAEQAMLQIRAHKPEMILLDLKLPGMDGLRLARRLKQDPDTRDIPIVAITAAGEIFTKEAALKSGCDAFILKPIDTRKLSGQIDAVAEHRSRATGEE
jgi:two-component system, cell cycle response regulator